MAKILVADDNSNVQKTVALALVDLGVEVIAVNNGDAAVRKLPDILPDLVLADIFMPVRNGYEVCEYVKKDTRFSHVPVVLLVGAFDPLDEREAQRVGADGILKKPFVPPDPLIAMVKTLLDRTLSDRLVAVGAAKTAASSQAKSGGVATAEQPPSAPQIAEPAPEEEYHPPVDRVAFDEGAAPIAFEQLLGSHSADSAGSATEAIEPLDDEQILTSSRDASLGDPIFWRTESPEPESREDDPEASEENAPDLSMRSWKLDPDALPVQTETDFTPAAEPPVEPPFELVREENSEAASETPTIAEPSPLIAQDAASQAALTVEAGKAPDLAANPIEWMASIPPSAAEELPVAAPDWDAPASDGPEAVEANEAESAKHLELPPETLLPGAAAEPVRAQLPISSSASSTAAPPSLSPATPPVAPEAKVETRASDPEKTQPALAPIKQSAEDTARSIPKQEWADLAASLEIKAMDAAAERLKPAPASESANPTAAASVETPAAAPAAPASLAAIAAPPAAPADAQAAASASAAPSSPDPALVEAVVQRVLEKMRPQVVDIITKEFLRPVVQALVHREIQKH